MKKKNKSSWVVLVRCVIEKEVICDNCTNEEAMKYPWKHCIEEREVGMIDWETLSSEPND